MTTYHIEESGQYKAHATYEAHSKKEALDKFFGELRFIEDPGHISIDLEHLDREVWEEK